ncbi:LOW QUALITY PROTEIN: exosome complex component 10 homolog [Culicoides brevitarsis]|uniref:LOW QUALITY PROTEIN: exosome complex component 10 homolog n=1 Tax=Culicoides brevitarsis TaxID=469753 RepID=UPI00307B24AC
MSETPEIDVQKLSQDGIKLIVQATKCTNAMPSGHTRELYNSHPAFRRIIAAKSNRLLELISGVIRKQGVRGNIVNRRDNEEKFELLQECNDVMLERINNNLDDLLGLRKSPDTILVQEEFRPVERKQTQLNGSWNRPQPLKSVGIQSARLLTARNIQRPQAMFKTPVDNSTNAWCPRIKYKPNSIRPLAILAEYGENNKIISYTHPYEMELEKFEPSDDMLTEKAVVDPVPIETGDLVYIDDLAELKRALAEFQMVNELAIDLEHHSYRTFQGITCLMQISTRTKDYIFDTIALREELHILNEVFTKPDILKVFHGADSDIEWLQRDLSLYIVNMFDTHQAAKRLGFERLSLAYLLKHFCKIEADKTFQLADWRMRPLPEELIDYARQDTHYLLYIYDNMRNQLVRNSNEGNNLIRAVYQASTEICKKRYSKPVITSVSHMDIYRKSKKVFDNRQLYALQHLNIWRDKVAREEDESYGFVLPNHMMLQISEVLPREMQGILACCNPLPPLVKQHLHILHQIILKAREQSLVKPIEVDVHQINREAAISNHRDQENPLYCPHDLGHHDANMQLSCLFDKDLKRVKDSQASKNSLIAKEKPKLSIFQENVEEIANHAKEAAEKVKNLTFITPYKRFKLYAPYAAELRAQEEKRQKEKEANMKLCPDVTPDSIATKHKLDEDEEDKDAAEVRQIIKKRKTEVASGYKPSIKIFKENGITEEEEEMAKINSVIDQLANIRQAKTTPVNTPKSQNRKWINPASANSTPVTPKPNTSMNKFAKSNLSESGPSTEKRKLSKSERRKLKTQQRQQQNTPNRNQKNNKTPTSSKNANQGQQSKPLNPNEFDFKRFGGGSKPATDNKQFKITQKFKGKNNNRRHRGNPMNQN